MKQIYDNISDVLNTMTVAEKKEFVGLFTPTLSPLLPYGFSLSDKQAFYMIMRQQPKYTPMREFIMLLGDKHGVDVSFIANRPIIPKEALYGGSGNSGKSYMLSALGLSTADVYGLDVRVFTSEKQAKSFSGGVGKQIYEWIAPVIKSRVVRNDEEKAILTFPSGGTIHFCGLDNENSWKKYKGGNIAQMIFDEVTEIHPESYTKQVGGWCRKSPRALRLGFTANACAATNPNGKYTTFYRERFVEGGGKDTFYLKALPKDNPFIDYESYKRDLENLGDPVFAAQMLDGRWDVMEAGDMFKPGCIREIDDIPQAGHTKRGWDIAATTKKSSNMTAGVKMRYYDGIYYIMDADVFKEPPDENDKRMRLNAQIDGRKCEVVTELQPAAAGKYLERDLNKNVFHGFSHRSIAVPKDKVTRARPFSIACANGLVCIWSRCRNRSMLIEQLVAFPNGIEDDIVDACTLVFNAIQEQVASYTGSIPQSSSKGTGGAESVHKPNRVDKRSRWNF